MSNLVLDRIQRQTKGRQIERPALVIAPPPPPPLAPALDAEVLRKIFLNEMEPVEPPVESVNEKTFSGVQDFANWYEANREKFPERQHAVLNTVIDARNVIDAGCSCQRHKRKEMAENYYHDFWLNNQNTDLPATVAEVAGVSVVKFLKDGNLFLTYTKKT